MSYVVIKLQSEHLAVITLNEQKKNKVKASCLVQKTLMHFTKQMASQGKNSIGKLKANIVKSAAWK